MLESNTNTQVTMEAIKNKYNRIGSLPIVGSHLTVNHSLMFVDPVTGAYTQHVELYWNHCMTKLKRMKGCVEHQIPSYLDEFMCQERHGTSRVFGMS